jgi:transposase
MLSLDKVEGVYLVCGSTDLRKSIDGLVSIVQDRLKLNPFGNYLFLFCNRSKDKIKVLHFERNGFWIYDRRLETGTFKWPNSEQISEINMKELKWLLEGFALIQHQKGHVEISGSIAY